MRQPSLRGVTLITAILAHWTQAFVVSRNNLWTATHSIERPSSRPCRVASRRQEGYCPSLSVSAFDSTLNPGGDDDTLLSHSSSSFKYVILGGTGQIDSAVAQHLLLRRPKAKIVLVGRRPLNAVTQTLHELRENHASAPSVEYERVSDIWNAEEMHSLLNTKHPDVDCVLHTAGPYANRRPVPLQVAMNTSSCRVYVDVSDPLPFLEQSLLLSSSQRHNLTALVAAGAFPGMSNVLGIEAAMSAVTMPNSTETAQPAPSSTNSRLLESLDFRYFTAGLGGSGNVNLFITNLGFGEPMVQFNEQGALQFYMALSGVLLGSVNFFLPSAGILGTPELEASNFAVKERVGRRQVFAWPFPEAATVPTILQQKLQNSKEEEYDEVSFWLFRRMKSSAAMGTAPDVWNALLGLLVSIAPRVWWRNERFSKFLADFSQPLVRWADELWLKPLDRFASGETHAMRIDARLENGSGVSIIQAHDSFRNCVGQSCAEFAMDCLEHPDPGTVSLPEQRYWNKSARNRIITKLTNTLGTFCYTGSVRLDQMDGPS